MELCAADFRRLERAGYSADDFSALGPDGVRRLKNFDGRCFFFDPESGRCREYARRPLGCVLYPVNLSEDGDFVVDESCPEWRTVTQTELDDKGRRLRLLVDTIRSEAGRR